MLFLSSRAQAIGRDLNVLAERDLLWLARAEFLRQVAPHFVFVGERVQEPGGERLLGEERPCVNGGAHLIGRLLAGVGDAGDQVAIDGVEHAVHDLFALRAHLGAREHVAKVLVLAGMLDLHADADLVQGGAEVHALGANALEIEGVGGVEVDAVGGGGQVVFARAGAAQVGVDGLARFAELGERGADLLQLGPAHGEVLGVERDGADVFIDGGFAQRHPDVGDGDGRLVAAQEGDFHRRLFRHFARQVHDQHGIGGEDRRLVAEADQEQEEQKDREEGDQHAGGESDQELNHTSL